MKKMTSIIAAIGLLFGSFPAAAQDMDIEAFCDSQKNIVTAEITAPEAGTDPIVVYVLAGDSKGFTSDMLTPENIGENLVGMGEAVYTDGTYRITIHLPENLPSAWYLVTAGDVFAMEDQGAVPIEDRQDLVFYADADLTAAAMAAVNAAGKGTIDGVLAQYADVYGIDITEEYSNTVGTALLSLKNTDFDGEFDTLSQIHQTYPLAQSIGMILDAAQDEKPAAIEKYGAAAGLVTNADYEKYTADVAELMVKNQKPASDSADVHQELLTVFRDSLALAALNNSTREGITKVLEDYTDVFALSTTSQVYRENTLEMNKALAGKGFTTVKAVQDAYAQREQTLSPGKTEPPKNSGTGGGGSSSVGYRPPAATPTPSPVPTQKPEQPAEAFSDLDGAEWAQEAIYALYDQGIVSGYGDGTFGPGIHIKREEFIKMLVSAYDLLDAAAEYTFTDGDKTAWYAPYLASARQAGIASGYADGSFGIGRELTREEMAAMAFRASGMEAGGPAETLFTDDSLIAQYAKPAVYAMRDAGVISGMEDGSFAPGDPATRAQAARIIYMLTGGKDGE